MENSDEKEKSSSSSRIGPYIGAQKFEGQKKGYCFKNGDNGLGYYIDPVQIRSMKQQQSETKEMDTSKSNL